MEVDFNNDGEISIEEFIRYWKIVKAHGHSEEEMKDELDNIENKEVWTGFENVKLNNTGKKMSRND